MSLAQYLESSNSIDPNAKVVDSVLALETIGLMEDLQEISATLEDVASLESIADSLDQLVVTAEGITSPSANECKLFKTATTIALIGTGISANDVLPSMEGRVEEISTEGLKQVAVDIWDAIKRGIAAVWARIKAFWKRLLSAIPGLKKSANSLAARAEACISKTQQESKTKLGRESKLLTVEFAQLNTGDAVTTHLNTLHKLSESFFDDQMEIVNRQGKLMVDAIKEFDVTDYTKSALAGSALHSACEGIDSTSPLTKLITVNVNSKSYYGIKSNNPPADVKELQLLNSMSIYYIPPGTLKGVTPTAELISMKQFKFDIRRSFQKEPDFKEDVEMDTISPETAISIAETIIELCDVLEKYELGDRSKNLAKTKDDMGKTTDKLKSSYDTASKKDDFDKEIKPLYNAVVGLNSAFTTWSTSTPLSLSSLIVSTSHAAIAACNKSLSNYK